jgi:cytochrome o ubiquinol oxidase subunit 2
MRCGRTAAKNLLLRRSAELLNSGILAPEGPVSATEAQILFDATAIMLAVIIPVMLATVGFAWWFRDSNKSANYRADWTYSGHVELVVWSVPTLVVLFLAGITWIGTHQLDPFKPLESADQALNVQVVSLDWKWLFLYPDEGIATVNELVIPAGRPLHFSITSATVMNSLLIPQLGSQIYAMAGMVTQLNLKADRVGSYKGLSAQFSGSGFSDMTFDVKSVSANDFKAWVDRTHSDETPLDDSAYAELAKPSVVKVSKVFGKVQSRLFDMVIRRSGGQNQVNGDYPSNPTPMEMR